MKKTDLIFFEEFWSRKKGRCLKTKPVWTDGNHLYIKRDRLYIDVTGDNRVNTWDYYMGWRQKC